MSTHPESPVESEANALLPQSTDQTVLVHNVAGAADHESLPEYEPLTAELVEDEAVRGDFVIRWATVLLALLFGWTQIDDTSLLVRIRNGQQHLLPFGVDPFSASAGDRTWRNTAWLSDPILAATYGVVGASGLTILGAVVAALTFWFLSRTSVKGVSTWWGSVCAAVALVAAFPQLIPGPTGITLLGVSLIVFLLFRWSQDRSAGFVWQIPVSLWVWSQLDSRAWIGSAILLLYALSWIGLRGFEDGDSADKAKNLWKITGASLLAWVLHPLHYHVLLSPLTAYQTEYPEVRAYKVFDWPFAWQWYPVFSVEFQERLDLFSVCSLGLCVLALLTFALNYKRLTWEWLLPWAGVVALAVFCAHQLPVAALLSCALITINAQLWYRGTFSQQYTVDAMPLAWNRGGRAITVVSLLLLGLIGSNGMLMGRDGRRIGSGFAPQMLASMAGAEKLASEIDAKSVFNFRLEQGDLLIWAGLKPYVDRRVTLYAMGGEDLLAKHRQLRYSVLVPNSKDSNRGKPEVWKPEFEKLHINHAIPRLSGPSPDYQTLVEMLSQGWAMTSLQSFGAVLSRRDSPDEDFQKYLLAHSEISFVKQAFQTEAPKSPPTDVPWIFPRRPTVYDSYLWQPQTTLNEPLQLAAHEQSLLQLLSATGQNQEMLVTTTSLAMSAFRHARQGIAIDPQSAPGYRIMARSASFLQRIDAFLAANLGMQYQGNFWLTQSLQAFHHALQLDPSFAPDHEELAAIQMQMGKRDLALNHMVQVYRLTGKYTTLPANDPRHAQSQKDNTAAVTELKRHIKQVEEAVLKAPTQGGTWESSLQAAIQGECPGIALRILEENRTEVAKNPRYQVMQVSLLMDVGRTDDAQQQAASLGNMIPKTGPDASQPMSTQIRILYALASLANGDNAQMELLIREESRLVTESAVRTVIDQAPLALGPNIQLDLLAAAQGYTAYQALYQSPERWANDEFMLAQSELSTWHNDLATTRLKAILEAEPNVNMRPLICYYLEMLTGETQQMMSPEMQAAAAKAAAQQAAPPVVPAEGDAPVTPPATTPADPAKTSEPVETPTSPETPSPPTVETPATPDSLPADPAVPPAPPEATPAAEQKPE